MTNAQLQQQLQDLQQQLNTKDQQLQQIEKDIQLTQKISATINTTGNVLTIKLEQYQQDPIRYKLYKESFKNNEGEEVTIFKGIQTPYVYTPKEETNKTITEKTPSLITSTKAKTTTTRRVSNKGK